MLSSEEFIVLQAVAAAAPAPNETRHDTMSERSLLLQPVAAAVLAVLVVALSTYGRRYRHPVVRVIIWGASTAFVPLTSSIISSLLRTRNTDQERCRKLLLAIPACSKIPNCNEILHSLHCSENGSGSPEVQTMWTLLLWAVLVHIVKGYGDAAATSSAASSVPPSTDDANVDGQKVQAPVVLLCLYAYVAYLIVICVPEAKWLKNWRVPIFIGLFVTGLAKVVLRLAVFFGAGGSYALGKNARLVAGYMEQLEEDEAEEGDGHVQVPPYIVMGERQEYVEESPEGFRISRKALDDKSNALVTLDRVWLLSDHGDGLLADRRELRDLCLSYSLFKSLRRRLSGYPLAEEGSSSALDFVLRGMDTAVAADRDRVFRVLLDELWFASDFYYSSLPLCLFSGWCAALNYLFSVLIIAGAVTVGWIYKDKKVLEIGREYPGYRSAYFVITYALLLAVVLAEAWEIVAGMCSNWTKMALLGHYIRRESLWRRFRCAHATLGAVLRLRPAKRLSEKIGQNSVLEPRRFSRRSGFLFPSFFSGKAYGRAGLMKSVKVPPAVKDAVLRSLERSYGGLNKGSAAARRVGRGGKVDDWTWPGSEKSLALDGAGSRISSSITEHILACHIGTRLFEMHAAPPPLAVDDMAAACHLSFYCAYLVAVAPGLLPDSPAWTEKRYKEVVKDVQAALGKDGAGKTTTYERLLKELSASSRDKILQLGADYGRRLVEAYAEEEEAAWRFLADFWSEMLLFVAPTKNIKGHVQAMGYGGEFVTLVWALLLHAGVASRPETPGKYYVV